MKVSSSQRLELWTIVISTTLISGSYFFGLGQYLGATPGSLLTEEIDVLFSSDAGGRWRVLSGMSVSRLSVSHPLLGYLWGNIGGLLHNVLIHGGVSNPAAAYFAASLLTCIVASIGMGCLVYFALQGATSPSRLIALFPVCLLFTANILLVVPEHQGLSFGLLGAATLSLLPSKNNQLSRNRFLFLLVVFFLLAGTTSTNALFAGLCGLALLQQTRSWSNVIRRHWVSLALIGCLTITAGVAVILWKLDDFRQGDSQVHLFLNWRLLQDPLAAARYVLLGVIYPAVGPPPLLTTVQGHLALTYEPLGISSYTFLSGMAAIAWAALLISTAWAALRSPDTRRVSLVLLLWVALNLIFHNLWGDEFFLYSPHWSWALMLVVLLGAHSLPLQRLILLSLLIIPGQIETLLSIRAVLP